MNEAPSVTVPVYADGRLGWGLPLTSFDCGIRYCRRIWTLMKLPVWCAFFSENGTYPSNLFLTIEKKKRENNDRLTRCINIIATRWVSLHNTHFHQPHACRRPHHPPMALTCGKRRATRRHPAHQKMGALKRNHCAKTGPRV